MSFVCSLEVLLFDSAGFVLECFSGPYANILLLCKVLR